MATGSESKALRDRAGFLYTMHGSERISLRELRSLSLLHALVLTPNVPMHGSGSRSQMSCLDVLESFDWLLGGYQHPPVPEQKKTLTIQYHGGSRMVTIGGLTYDTRQGNVFIIVLNANWKPTVRQVATVLESMVDLTGVLAALKAAIPDDEEINRIELYPTTVSQSPNKAVKLSVRPVTRVANGATRAPARPAAYGRRWTAVE